MRTKERSWVKVSFMFDAVLVIYAIHVKGRVNNKYRTYRPTRTSLQRLMRVLVEYC